MKKLIKMERGMCGEVITKFSGDVIPTSDVVRHYIDVATNHSVNENHGDE